MQLIPNHYSKKYLIMKISAILLKIKKIYLTSVPATAK